MKNPYIIILIGICLVVAGFLMYENIGNIPVPPIIDKPEFSINSNSEHKFKINSEGNRMVNVNFLSQPADQSISLKVLNPDQSILWEGKSQFNPAAVGEDSQFIATKFHNPNPKGNLDVIITNMGDKNIIVRGEIRDLLELNPKEIDVGESARSFYGVGLYLVLTPIITVIGFILLIIGAVLFFKGRKLSKKKN